jgi:IS30 family transposase
MPSRAANCAVNSLPVCATATARARRTPGARTGADRFPTWSVSTCAPEIEDRLRSGHWKDDFIKGANNQSSVGVLVERTSRLMLLAKMEDVTVASALAGFPVKLNSIVAPLRQNFTYDQGKEMSRHQELTAATGVNVYFCGVSRT